MKAIIAITLVSTLCGAAHGGTLKTLYSFAGGADGANPYAGLANLNGILYGTTIKGGAAGEGTIFTFNPAAGAENVAYSFGESPDGALPHATLINVKGILYGTTNYGGTANVGAIFKFNPVSDAESVLYSFTNTPDGAGPYASLFKVGSSLFGTTSDGGGNDVFRGAGTVFKFHSASGRETVFHTFTGNPDGATPFAAVIEVSGLLYGTTTSGGVSNSGAVFALNPATGVESLVYSFAGGSDGAQPNAALINVGGTLYGVTAAGGTANKGTVFSLNIGTGVESVVHSFTGGRDGAQPSAALISVGGTLYGTTSAGGPANEGTIYKVNPTNGKTKVVYSFTGGTDGAAPFASLIKVGALLYGTTLGTNGEAPPAGLGTVFSFEP
jgi:uncharacterized repeat protein (TIGR03803 family)